MRRTSKRVQPCCICGADVELGSATTTNPEAPEMLRLPPDASIGFVSGDVTPEMVVCCSDRCEALLLSD